MKDGDDTKQQYSQPIYVQPGQRKARISLPPEIQKNVDLIGKEMAASGLVGHMAKVGMVLDVSGSMGGLYDSQKIHALVAKAIALACKFDDDQSIEVFPFAERCLDPWDVKPNDFPDVIDDILDAAIKQGICGGTNYADAFDKVIKHYFPEQSKIYDTNPEHLFSSQLPHFMLFITDGNCDSQFVRSAKYLFEKSSHFCTTTL